jgi:hypothetical protein
MFSSERKESPRKQEAGSIMGYWNAISLT